MREFFLLMCLMAIVHSKTTSSVTYHHLKWITNKTQFPFEMSVPVSEHSTQQQVASSQTWWDWLRLNDNKWVSQMDGLLKSYLVRESTDAASLVILNYDNKTHEQLGSYEPRLMHKEGSLIESVIELGSAGVAMSSNKRDIFTLAYLKDHYIKSEKFPDRIKVTCIADFLIANSTLTDTIMSLMERYASFKMAVKSIDARYSGPPPAPRIQSHNRNHLRPNDARRRPTSEQLQQLQKIQQMQKELKKQLMQQQQLQKQMQKQQLEQIQKQQQQQQSDLTELHSFLKKMMTYQPPPTQLLELEKQKNQAAKDLARVQEADKIPQYQQLYQPIHNGYSMLQSPLQNTNLQPAAYQNDLISLINSGMLYSPTPLQVHSTPGHILSSQQSLAMPLSQQLLQQQQNVPHYIPISPYEYIFNPRLGKREVKSSMVNEKLDYELDSDESKFLKIRLSLGPVSIYRPFDREEVISCDLNLLNIDTMLSEYENKIFETINMQEYVEDTDEEVEEDGGASQFKPPLTWLDDDHKTDAMFLIDNKGQDPAVEIKKAFESKPKEQQEQITNRIRDKPILELIEMEKQFASPSSATSIKVGWTTVAILCAFIAYSFSS